jgi:hypothetical protein
VIPIPPFSSLANSASGQPIPLRRLAAEGRGLAEDTDAIVNQCFDTCESVLRLSIPFFFSVLKAASGNICLCGESGELIYGPGFQVG